MAIRFGDAVKAFSQGQEIRRKKYDDSVNALVKEAQIKELGYDIQPGQGRFGPTLVERPGFASLKQLQRQKMERELDPNYMTAYQRARVNGGFGQPKPLNELQQAQLADRQRKAEAETQAIKDQEEALRTSAQENLNTIGEVKKGINYFGPMGDVPSAVAPSTIKSFGADYGNRKNWESNVNKLLSNKVLEVMAELKKSNGKGGTGFGALSEKELLLLQNASTALNRGLNPDDAMRYLNDIERINRKVLSQGQFGQGGNSENNFSEEDIQFTMQQNNMTREQVLKELGLNG